MEPKVKSFLLLIFLILILPSCEDKKTTHNPAISENNASAEFSITELKKRTFHFFWDLAYENNLQIPDRHPTLRFSSIAGTGFGFTAYLIGAENGFITAKTGIVQHDGQRESGGQTTCQKTHDARHTKN